MKIPFTDKSIRLGKSDAALEKEIVVLKKDLREATSIIRQLTAENERLLKKNLELRGRESEAREIAIHSEAMKRFADRGD